MDALRPPASRERVDAPLELFVRVYRDPRVASTRRVSTCLQGCVALALPLQRRSSRVAKFCCILQVAGPFSKAVSIYLLSQEELLAAVRGCSPALEMDTQHLSQTICRRSCA